MSELTRLLEARKRYAKQWKILGWTVGMTFGVFLITDGKTTSQHPLQHLLIGAALGLALGVVFSRSMKTKSGVD